MNSLQLDDLLAEVKQEIKHDVPYRHDSVHVYLNNRKSALGVCKNTINGYIIEVSKYLLKCNRELIKNVIAHELIHTVKGCFNHGYMFRAYARSLNRLGYNVEVKNNDKQFGQNIQYKYKLTCLKCGVVFYRHRLCKGDIRHSTDNGKIKVEQLF